MNLPNPLAETPAPPFYAVIFTSQRSAEKESGYQKMAGRMMDLATQQDGFLGVESVRDECGTGITVSYWRDRESIQRWREVTEHLTAQEHGRPRWYQRYHVRICLVEHQYGFDTD